MIWLTLNCACGGSGGVGELRLWGGVAWEDASACELFSAYGSTKRYKSVERVCKVNDHTLLAASGEISDFQYLQVRDCVNAW